MKTPSGIVIHRCRKSETRTGTGRNVLWLDDLKSENTRIATDWTPFQEKTRKMDTWLNGYFPGYEYALPVQQAAAARTFDEWI